MTRNFLRALFLVLMAAGMVLETSVPGRGQSSSTLAPSSRTISYQGLIEQNGMPIGDGIYPVRLTLYSDAKGASQLWQGTYTVQTSHGVFNVIMGSGDYPLPSSSAMDGALWLGVKIGEGDELPLAPLSAAPFALNVADSSITAKKMATPYVSSVSINGKPVTAVGTGLNLVGTDGISLSADPTTNSIYVSGSGTGNGSSGKGKDPQGSTQVAGTQYEVLANGTYGSYQSGNVTLTTPQAIATISSPTFANLTLTGKAKSAPTSTEDPDSTLTTKGYVSSVASNAIGHFSAGTGIGLTAGGVISNTGVLSFNARTGAVTLTAADVSGVGMISNATTGNAATASSVPWTGVNGKPNLVNTFNTRTGDVTLTTADITALGILSNATTGNAATASSVPWTGVTGKPNLVNTFNTRTGDVTLTTADITALGTLSNATTGNAATASSVPWTGVTGKPNLVNTFNTRTGDVTLTAADVNSVGTISNATTGNAATATNASQLGGHLPAYYEPAASVPADARNALSGTGAVNYNSSTGTINVDLSSYSTTAQTNTAINNAIAAQGLGTMATQNANNVAVTGGSISGTTFTGVYFASANTPAVAIPASAYMVEITDPGGSHIVTITLPAVVNGKEIHIHNSALAPTSGDIVIPPDGLFTVMGTGNHWSIEKN